jgi:hypothetical protein
MDNDWLMRPIRLRGIVLEVQVATHDRVTGRSLQDILRAAHLAKQRLSWQILPRFKRYGRDNLIPFFQRIGRIY